MLVQQHLIAEELYRFPRYWDVPLSKKASEHHEWTRYVRHTRDRWGYAIYRQADLDRHATAKVNNFASRMASYATQLHYEGKTIFAIQTGTYVEGEYVWSGPTDQSRAFTIRSAADYQEVYDWYFPAHDDGEGYYYDYDPDWSHSIQFVVAPTSIIK